MHVVALVAITAADVMLRLGIHCGLQFDRPIKSQKATFRNKNTNDYSELTLSEGFSKLILRDIGFQVAKMMSGCFRNSKTMEGVRAESMADSNVPFKYGEGRFQVNDFRRWPHPP